MRKMSSLDWIAWILVIIGGLNWGLVGAANNNVLEAIFGDMSSATRVIYVLVGLSAIWMLVSSRKMRNGAM